MSAVVTSTQSACAGDFDFAAYLEAARLKVESALDGSLGPERPESLREAMRYSLLAGGKRLRPILCLAACELAGGQAELAMPTAVGIACALSPPASSQAARQRIGRSRLPPANRE